MKRVINLIIVVVISSFLLFSCSDDDSNPVDNGNGNGETETKISGRVTDNNGYGNGLQKTAAGVEGAAVTTAEIQADGSLQTTSVATVQTDANGNFEVVTNSVNKSNVVVVATKGSSEWRAVISSQVTANQDNECPPLNSETTAEAKVYADVKAEGKTNTVSYADVAYYINSEVAAKVNSSTSSRSEVKNAIIADAEARISAMTNAEYGYSNTEYEEAKEVDESAQEDFENNVYLSSDTEAEYNAAWDAYFNAVVNGYSNTSVKMSHYAQFEEISGKAIIKLNSNLDTDSRFQMEKRNAYLKAKLLAKAMVEEYEKAGASEQERQTVEDENETLLVNIKSSSSADQINAAYVNYRSSIKAHLKSSFDLYAIAFTTIETAVESTIKTSLEASVNAASSVQAIVNAYATFYGSVRSTVSAESSISDATQVEAFANIYALIYMHN